MSVGAVGDALGPSLTEVRHVMYVVDFGAQSVKALHWAADFASEFSAGGREPNRRDL